MNTNSTNTDEYLKSLPAWQAKNLQIFRDLIHQTVPATSEEIKWGVPVFIYQAKTLFAMSAFKAHTKYNFIQNGALLADPNGLFNNGFESKKSRGIDLREGETVNSEQLQELIASAAQQA
jgi:hypothetical protein